MKITHLNQGWARKKTFSRERKKTFFLGKKEKERYFSSVKKKERKRKIFFFLEKKESFFSFPEKGKKKKESFFSLRKKDNFLFLSQLHYTGFSYSTYFALFHKLNMKFT